MVHHFLPTVEVEIMEIDPNVEKAVWSYLREKPSSGVKVFLTRKPFRGTRKAFIRMEEARALMLL